MARLGDVAVIKTGVFAKPTFNGDIVYLQSKHFRDDGLLSSELHPDILSTVVSAKHLLDPGDILFAAKGTKNFAAVFESHNPPSVASTSFFVISLHTDKVIPNYLAWLLNHPITQKHLKSRARGTSIPSISKKELLILEIPIPALKIQQNVMKISQLRIMEKKIAQEIEMLKEKLIQQQLLTAIN